MSTKPRSGTAAPSLGSGPERPTYSAPALRRWGTLRDVTLKTGSNPDMNQTMKMGFG